MATAGGTGVYYPVELFDGQADSSALTAALADIATRIERSCQLALEDIPSPTESINVVLKGKTVPQNGPNGWGLNGKIVTLFGEACDQVTAGGSYDVTSGCPTLRTGDF
jgi:hypothetical protein